MKAATFAKAYDHPTATGHLAYPAGYSGEVSDETYTAAEKAGVLKVEKADKKPDASGR